MAHLHSLRGQVSPTYQSWQHMKDRCTNPRSRQFHKYGGRGIAVCSRWLDSFEHFLVDMGQRPAGTTIDRIDNERGYEPGNCRWATQRTQQRNRRDTVLNCVAESLILHLRRRGARTGDIAHAFGVSQSTVTSLFRSARKRGVEIVQPGPPIACRRGHEFTASNTYRRPDGRRTCRACKAQGR